MDGDSKSGCIYWKMIEHLFHTIAIVASTDSRLVLLIIKVSQLEIIVTHLKFVFQKQ